MQKIINVREQKSRCKKFNRWTSDALKWIGTLLLVISLAPVIAQTVTLSAKKIAMKDVFAAVKKQTNYSVFGNLDLLEQAKPVSIDAKNMQLDQFLTLVVQGQPFTYRIGNKTIFLSAKDTKTPAEKTVDITQKEQQVDSFISGRVLDSLNQPLPGASISLKNRNFSTSTDQFGRFAFTAQEGDIMLISFVGHKSQNLTVNKRMLASGADLTVLLSPIISTIDEIRLTVNTGYQTLSKERSAGSVAKPDMDIYNDRVGTMNVVQRLDGLIPGLTVNNAPNADQFQIRGLTTVGSTVNIGGFGVSTTNRSPLFVVDGVPYEDISLINPNDVLDVNVLKDATAASIWGARAANGVIVITTKAGQKGTSKLKVDYNSFVRIQNRPDLKYLGMMDSRSYIQAAREIFDPVLVPWATINGGTAPIVAPHERTLYDLSRGLITSEQADTRLDSMSMISNLDQMSELFYRTGIITNHALSVGGSSDKYSFYGSFNYTGNRNNGNRPEDSNNIYKLNIRQDFRFNNNINLYLISDVTNTMGKISPYPTFDSRFNPYQLFRSADGENLDLTWRYMTAERRQDIETKGGIDIGYVPLDEPNLGYTNSNNLTLRLNSGLNVKLYKGLRFEGTYSYARGKNDTRIFQDQMAFETRRELLSYTTYNMSNGQRTYHMPSTGGRLTTQNSSREDWTIRNQLVYNKDWEGLRHQLTLLGGNEVQSMRIDNANTLVRGFNDEYYTAQPVDYKTLSGTVLSGTLYPSTGGFGYYYPDTYTARRTDTRLVSYYANLAYSFIERYGINASWRIDRSNLYGLDKSAQNRPVYSVGALWNINREQWMQEINWVDELRLRATYGLTGISPAPGVASTEDILLALAPSGYTVPGGTIFRINSPALRSLSWELTKTKNLGMDFRLFNSRISGNLDLYWKKTEGLLDNMLVNPFAIAVSPTVLGNTGELTNRGIELSLTSVNIKTNDFMWRTLLNGAYNKNKITKSYNATTVTSGDAKVTQTNLQGESAYALFAYDYAGLDNLGDPQIRRVDGTVVKTPYVTMPEDILFMGTTQPKWSGGFSNFFKYRAFDLQVNMVFNAGHVTRRDVNQRYTGGNAQHNNFHADFANRWKTEGDETKTDVPSFVSTASINNSRRSTYYYMLGNTNVIDASFVKIRDLTLSYRIPKEILNRIHCSELRVFGQLGNIMLWKANEYGIDPEFHSANNLGGVRTLRTGQNTVSFGLNVSF